MKRSHAERLAILGVTFALLVAAVPAPRPMTANDVRTITIDSAWSGLGNPANYHAVITHRGNAFVRDDGSTVPAAQVDDLLGAVTARHPNAVSAANAGLTSQSLMTVLGPAETYLGGAQSDPRVRVAFAREFADQHKVQAWLDDEARAMHTDDDPSISVRVATTKGTFTISSRSYHLLMLPFTIETPSGASDAYDARLAYAVAALLPANAANAERLELRWLMTDWAQEVARMPDVQAAINGGDARTRVATAAFQNDLRLLKFETSDGTNWTGEFTWRRNARIHTEVLCIPNARAASTETSCLRDAAERVRAVARVPWVRRALQKQDHGYIVATYGDTIGRTSLYDWATLASSPTAAAYVNAHTSPVQFVRFYPDIGQQIRLPYSYWLLFPDGTMALEEYGSGLRGFPFADKAYDELFTHVDHHLGMMQFVGMLRRPDGTWIKDKP